MVLTGLDIDKIMNKLNNTSDLVRFIQMFSVGNAEQMFRDCFRDGHFHYGELAEDGSVVYFFDVVNAGACSYLSVSYINPKHRDKSTRIFTELKDELRNLGSKTIAFSSNNLKSSFRRWVAKIGAEPQMITYKIGL